MVLTRRKTIMYTPIFRLILTYGPEPWSATKKMESQIPGPTYNNMSHDKDEREPKCNINFKHYSGEQIQLVWVRAKDEGHRVPVKVLGLDPTRRAMTWDASNEVVERIRGSDSNERLLTGPNQTNIR